MTVPSWYRRQVNRDVRNKLNHELRMGRELSDWDKWGVGLTGWYW